jgi:dTDP-L-rhamnose 4-epimerase
VRVLLTGSAGFIGACVAGQLTRRGHEVVGVDAMIPQAHAEGSEAPEGTHAVDIRDGDALEHLLAGADVVCHQAAMVGNGVDAQDLPAFAAHNDLGTAVLLPAMARAEVDRLVLASSMVVYGDGLYRCEVDGEVGPAPRRTEDLEAGRFDPRCPHCDRLVAWTTVTERAPIRPRSSYAASKMAQEHFTDAWCTLQQGRAIALRYHNVYGPGMPADTPYAGVAAIFRSALERGQAPTVFEDGGQMRDFVHVTDVAAANVDAIEQLGDHPVGVTAYNVCSGHPVSIGQMAQVVARAYDGPEPVADGQYRAADVRHVVADPTAASDGLGFVAAVTPERGLAEFATAPLRPTS